jgi:hypothetical protein
VTARLTPELLEATRAAIRALLPHVADPRTRAALAGVCADATPDHPRAPAALLGSLATIAVMLCADRLSHAEAHVALDTGVVPLLEIFARDCVPAEPKCTGAPS